MSYRNIKKENDYKQHTKNKTRRVNNSEDINENEKNNFNEEELNNTIKAFKYFDMNKNGKINILELKHILSNFGDIMSENELNKIFRIAGIDLINNENINYMEFINYWIGNNK